MSERLEITVGETAVWPMTLTAAGAPVDLTAAGAITLTMVDKTGNAKKIDASACSVVSAADGTIQYVPVAGDVDEPGEYRLQIKASLGGKTFFFPNGPTPNTVLIARAVGS